MQINCSAFGLENQFNQPDCFGNGDHGGYSRCRDCGFYDGCKRAWSAYMRDDNYYLGEAFDAATGERVNLDGAHAVKLDDRLDALLARLNVGHSEVDQGEGEQTGSSSESPSQPPDNPVEAPANDLAEATDNQPNPAIIETPPAFRVYRGLPTKRELYARGGHKYMGDERDVIIQRQIDDLQWAHKRLRDTGRRHGGISHPEFKSLLSDPVFDVDKARRFAELEIDGNPLSFGKKAAMLNLPNWLQAEMTAYRTATVAKRFERIKKDEARVHLALIDNVREDRHHLIDRWLTIWRCSRALGEKATRKAIGELYELIAGEALTDRGVRNALEILERYKLT